MPIERKSLKQERRSKISSFMSAFEGNVARPNLFHVEMQPPNKSFSKNQVKYNGTAYNTIANDELELRVQSVTMPGKNITTTPNDNAYGPSYQIASGISYAEEIEVTYILDSDHRAKNFFNDWQDKIVDKENYDLNYYDDYVGKMFIFQLDQNDNNASAVEVDKVFPKSVGPIEYSMGSTGAFQTVSVMMSFKSWKPIVINYNGTHSASWIDNRSNLLPWTEVAANQSGQEGQTAIRDYISHPLYKLEKLFGIEQPPQAQQLLRQLNSTYNFTSDPTQFLKREIGNTIGTSVAGSLFNM
jgi:hypothetical protein